MKNVVIGLLATALVALLAFEVSALGRGAAEAKLAHMVFFGLKDRSKESIDRFIASCEKNLRGHDGCVYFSVGRRAEDVDESSSVKDFDVALHVVFASKEGKLKYLKNPRHDQFVEENRSQFDKVRVFDSYLAGE